MHRGPTGDALAHQLMTLGDPRRAPVPTVVLVDGNQFAAGRNPSGAAATARGILTASSPTTSPSSTQEGARIRRVSRIASAVRSCDHRWGLSVTELSGDTRAIKAFALIR